MTDFMVDVAEHGSPVRRVAVTDGLVVGREGAGLLLSGLGTSRQHARFTVAAGRLFITDLGSTNGTFVNNAPTNGATPLAHGDVIAVGDVRLTVLVSQPVPDDVSPHGTPVAPAPPAPPVAPAPAAAPFGPRTTEPAAAPGTVPTTAPAPHPVPGPAAAPPPPRPVLEELEARVTDAAVVRYRPGTAGAKAAGGVAQAAKRARRRLEGLGSEPWGVVPTICLVDPFPDPERPSELVTSGVIVDASRGEIWMVVTPESPPEPLERPLALLFGGGLPAAAELAPLLEGYGLYVADTPNPDPELRTLELPPLFAAEGELASALRLSFVRYLIERGGRERFLPFLGQAQPGRIDTAAEQTFGAGMAALEEAWRHQLASGPPDIKAGQFLRLTARYLRPHRRREAEIFVYMLFGLAFTLVFPFVFRRLLDKAIPSGRFSETVSLLVVLLIAFAISLLAGLRRAYLSAQVSSSVVRQLRSEMFGKMQHVSQRWYSQHEQGDVISRLFSDVGVLEQGLSETLREGFFQLLSLLASAAVLLTLNPVLGIIVLAGAPVIAVVYRGMAGGAQKRSIAVQEQTGAVLAVASENYGAQGVVKAFALQAREIGRFRDASDRLYDREVKLQLFGGLFGLSVNMIVTILRVIILGLGAYLILHGHLTVGGLVAFMTLMGEVLAPVTTLTGIGQQVQAATGALVRINEVLDAPPEVDEQANAPALAPLSREIRLHDVGFSYSAERRTLEHINVVINAGERVAFVGPTGAGKSSVLQLIMRFYDVDEGAVLFDGQDVRHVDLLSLRSQLGVVFQETFLFNATIRDNIAFGRLGATDAQVEEASRAAELHDFVMTLPRGYDTLVGERGGRLSGGQKQRMAIARALLRDPRVILLDEATSALDPRTERLITDTLERVGGGRTTIAVTHRLTSITTYDRIFVIDAGHLVEQGTHDELLAHGGVYSQLWAEQTGGEVERAPFDAAAALAQIPLFARLDPAGLADAVRRLQAIELRPGDSVAEGGGRLCVVRQGRAHVLLPQLGGAMAPVAELGPGDAFGLSSLLGQDQGAVLQAIEPVGLLVLDDSGIRAMAGTYPDVAAVLGGTAPVAASPAGGTRLARMTIGPGAPLPVVTAPPGPSAGDVRRATGTMPRVQP